MSDIELPATPPEGDLLDMILDEARVQKLPLQVSGYQVGWAWVKERVPQCRHHPFQVIKTELF